ncbi:glycosyltransferase family 9 protein [Flavobacteriaceae bacterium M23B6Z8]
MPARKAQKRKDHLIVIRLSAMGDVAMTVPVLLALREQYPDIKITVLSRGFFKPLFEAIPNIEFFEADVKLKHKGISGLFKLAKEIVKLKPTAIADLHNVLRSNVLKVFFKLQRLPVVQIDKGRRDKKALTRLKNKKFQQLQSTHQRYTRVFETLGYPIQLKSSHVLSKRSLTSFVNDHIGAGNQKWIGIAPFAAFKGKMYPLDLMEEVIAKLDETKQFKLILLGGGKNEISILNNLESKYDAAVNMAGKISFSEELALISNLDVMLAMDSGNAHLAANYGVPTITLWGVTHPFAGFYPFAQPMENALLADRDKYPLIPTSVYGNKFPEGYEDVMRTIVPKEVVKLIYNKIK